MNERRTESHIFPATGFTSGKFYEKIKNIIIRTDDDKIESISVTEILDHRLFTEENQYKLINQGLWSWSRHPNYFGEITLWFGITIIAFPVLEGWQLVTLISPVFVYILLSKISGIAMVEPRADKKWGEDPKYQLYKETTPALIPMFKHKNQGIKNE